MYSFWIKCANVNIVVYGNLMVESNPHASAACTNLRILSEISGVSRNKLNEDKITILGSQKSKKVTKILHSHQWNLYQFYENKILQKFPSAP